MSYYGFGTTDWKWYHLVLPGYFAQKAEISNDLATALKKLDAAQILFPRLSPALAKAQFKAMQDQLQAAAAAGKGYLEAKMAQLVQKEVTPKVKAAAEAKVAQQAALMKGQLMKKVKDETKESLAPVVLLGLAVGGLGLWYFLRR